MIVMVNLANCTTYNVTPDDDCCPNGTLCRDDCHNLKYYLFSHNKYFTNNVQMYLLHGVHYLYTNLSIQNCHNFSLVGASDSVSIQCVRPCMHPCIL